MGKFKHGHNPLNGSPTPTYRSWISLRRRCKSRAHYEGVRVDRRWDDFLAFLKDMGERPSGTTIDRIDPHGDYTASNCRWATPTVQARNRRHQGGVRWVTKTGKWSSWMGHEGKDIYLGSYDDWWDAMCARKSAENKYWREA